MEIVDLESKINKIDYEYHKKCEEKNDLVVKNNLNIRRVNLSPVSGISKRNPFLTSTRKYSPERAQIGIIDDQSTELISRPVGIIHGQVNKKLFDDEVMVTDNGSRRTQILIVLLALAIIVLILFR